MKNSTHTAAAFPSTLHFRAQGYLLTAAAIGTLLLLIAGSSFAASATWKASPVTGDWNTATNWTPSTVPNGLADTATFATSNATAISLSAPAVVDGIVFNSGASAFTLSSEGQTLQITGAGITNNSGITQNFVSAFTASYDGITFSGNATAGILTAYTTTVSTFYYSEIRFFDTATAGTATITNNGGLTEFSGSSTAANGMVIHNEIGQTNFIDSSTAGNSTLIVNSGVIFFGGNSRGGQARAEVFAESALDIGFHNAPGVSIGSIEGDGIVRLGRKNLTVGSNNRSTTFSGLIHDKSGGYTGGDGSLTKIGTGKLTLSKLNTYTGGTTVNRGTLLLKNKGGSATGPGAVQVKTGTLRGTGIIAGAVTVGNGSSSGAILVGGESGAPGTLTINNPLTFDSLSTYNSVLKRSTPTASRVSALGVTINSNAQFVFVDSGTGTLAAGTAFTVINNTSASPIFGTFSNLPNGSTFTSNGTSFKVSYTGGTGNDLALTVQ
jgi:autotransporter-associated beta strand protein